MAVVSVAVRLSDRAAVLFPRFAPVQFIVHIEIAEIISGLVAFRLLSYFRLSISLFTLNIIVV